MFLRKVKEILIIFNKQYKKEIAFVFQYPGGVSKFHMKF